MQHLSIGFILIGIFFSFFSYGQSRKEIIESLVVQLKQTPLDEQKAKIAGDISYYYATVSADSALKYGDFSLKYAIKAKNDTILAQAYNDLATVYLVKGEYETSIDYCRKSYKIRNRLKDEAGIASLFVKLGNNFYKSAQYDSAMVYFLKSRDYYRHSGNKIEEKTIESNISTIYQSLGNYEKAIAFLESPNHFFDSIGAHLQLSNNLINLGNIQLAKGDTSDAISTYLRAEEACKLSGNYYALGALYNNLGETYFHLGELEKAADFIRSSLELRKSQGYQAELFSSYLTLGSSYFRQGAYDEAKPFLLLAMRGLEATGASDKLSRAYLYLSLIYAFEQKSDSLNLFLAKSNNLNHDMIQRQLRELTQEIEEKYQSVEKDKLLLQREQTLQAREIDLQRRTIWLITVLAVVLILLILLYNLHRQNQASMRQAELQKELAKELERTRVQQERLRISRELHDNIGSYLSVIKVSLDQLPNLTLERLQEKHPELLNVLSLSMRELRKTVWLLSTEVVKLEELALRLRDFFKSLRENGSHVNVKVEGNNSLELKDIEATHLFRILQEAVNNAYRHGQAREIDVALEGKEDHSVRFVVRDNGIGCNPELLQGGNGWQNMKSRIAELNGKLSIESKPGMGSVVEGSFRDTK